MKNYNFPLLGQYKIKNMIDTYDNISDFPQVTALIGEYGCGKHTLVKSIADYFCLDIRDISEDISKDLLDAIYLDVTSTIYIIDITKISKSKQILKLQNTLLKFLEEPPENCTIFVLCEYDIQLIQTVKNRCELWTFWKYSTETLSEVTNKNIPVYIENVLDTPGQLYEMKELNYYKGLYDLCTNIVQNITRASIGNTLTLVKNIDFDNSDNEEKKYPVQLFYKMFVRTLEIMLSIDYENYSLLAKFVNIANNAQEKSTILNVNQRYIFDDFLLNLKSII